MQLQLEIMCMTVCDRYVDSVLKYFVLRMGSVCDRKELSLKLRYKIKLFFSFFDHKSETSIAAQALSKPT